MPPNKITGSQVQRVYGLFHYRALHMYEMKMMGWSTKAVAAKFNIHPEEVTRSLDYLAHKTDTLKEMEQQIIDGLVPKAIEIYQKQLENGNVKLAKDVLDKLIAIGAKRNKEVAHKDNVGLRAYIEHKRFQKDLSNGSRDGIISVETVSAELTADSAPTDSVGTQRKQLSLPFRAEGTQPGDYPDELAEDAKSPTEPETI